MRQVSTMQHHALPENYDVVIEGTGLPEAIFAAACAWSGKKVFHLDPLPFYGGCWTALNLDEIRSLSNTTEDDSPLKRQYKYLDLSIPEPDQLPPSRSCSIDLSPRLLYCRSEMIDLLVSTKMSQYLEFIALGDFWLYTDRGFLKVPSGREDIFASKDLDLSTKRKTMKFLKFVLAYDEEENYEMYHEYAEKPLSTLLSAFNLTTDFTDSLIHVLASSADKSISTSVGLVRIRNHLSSLSVYGSFPCLLPTYGGGCELSQAFCRAAAVKGAVYMLNATLNGPYLSNGDRISYQHHFRGVNQGLVSFRVLLVKAQIEKLPFSRDGSVVVFPPDSMGNKNAITVRVHGSGTCECPKGYFNVYISTKGDQIDAFDSVVKEILQKAEDHSVLLAFTYIQGCNANDDTIAVPIVNNLESPTYDDAISEAKRLYAKVFGEHNSFFKVEATENESS
ncbi:putative Rab geranylgeranyltransferase [Neolecta irregularis DAH-3]|uniref:Putative Rab geranylgeranyltransferase n=1 Tax=Neolecta irregularis (strain DAH-3) TaxID=1198029 RepID=A0A1U7LTW5_NEOID|nr:putative Rab geranylgeranyltransferase [Neolecta irregularis DAH-3]|eukprot:OLL26058.1 putative Rab geranylgeranyltransferase [Neolecta irregularis DAH-3]